MKKQIPLLALAAALIAVPVLAAPGGSSRGDADGNGVVTRVEAEAAARAHFAKMDANADGKIDASDRAARMADHQAKRFASLDADSDGAITHSEWDAQHAARQAKRAERRAERVAAGDTEKRGHSMMRGKRGHRGGHMAGMMNADSDDDKAISQAEFTAAMLARFDGADADKDGQLTAAEKQAAHEARRSMRHRTPPAQPAQ